MEHRIILGGKQYLPFAQSCVAKLKKLGLPYASQTFKVDGVTINVKITPGHEYIRLEGGELPLYQFFTTGKDVLPRRFFPEVVAGYAIKVRLNPKTKTLEAIAKGSTAEPSLEDPPKWPYADERSAMSEFMPFKEIQVDGLNEHQFFPGAKGPRFLESVWTSAGQVADLADNGYAPITVFDLDLGYDMAPSIRTRGRARGSVNGTAPDADWYRRAACRTVEHPEHGSRFLVMLTDTSGNLHVYPIDEVDDDLSLDSLYANQFIKTNIPNEVVNKQKLPYPAWARPLGVVEDRETMRLAGGPNPDAERSKHGGMRWEFNSDATRMVCLIPSEFPEPVYGETKIQTELTGTLMGVTESRPGMLELGIEIELTGPEPKDFDVTLTVLNEVSPDDDRYIIAAQYYWGDIEDAHAPTGLEKDELVVMDLNVYHKRNPPVADTEPAYSSVLAVAQVKAFVSGTVIRQFTTHQADAPWGTDRVPYAGSFLEEYYELATRFTQELAFVTSGSLLSIDEPYGEYLTKSEAFMEPFIEGAAEVTPAAIAKLESMINDLYVAVMEIVVGIDSAASGISARNKNFMLKMVRLDSAALTAAVQMPNDSANVLTSLVAYDLRALAFAVQTSAFKNEGEELTRQDRVQVFVRNEVVHTIDPPSPELKAMIESFDTPSSLISLVKLDHREVINPSKSMFALRCLPHRVFETIAGARIDHNLDYPVGAAVYNRHALSFVCGSPFEIFCVHPAGHWSLATRALVYYSGKSKHFRYRPQPQGRPLDEAVDATPDETKFVQNIVDIISVQVIGKDQPPPIKSSHVEMFNQAYGKNLTPEDFHLKFRAEKRAEGFGVQSTVVSTVVEARDPAHAVHFIGLSLTPEAAQAEANNKMSVLFPKAPLSYMDNRNFYYTSLAKINNEGDRSAGFVLGTFRPSLMMPLLRGAALFGGTTLKVKP